MYVDALSFWNVTIHKILLIVANMYENNKVILIGEQENVYQMCRSSIVLNMLFTLVNNQTCYDWYLNQISRKFYTSAFSNPCFYILWYWFYFLRRQIVFRNEQSFAPFWNIILLNGNNFYIFSHLISCILCQLEFFLYTKIIFIKPLSLMQYNFTFRTMCHQQLSMFHIFSMKIHTILVSSHIADRLSHKLKLRVFISETAMNIWYVSN